MAPTPAQVAQPRETTPIIDQVDAAIARWPDFAELATCTKKITNSINKTLFTL